MIVHYVSSTSARQHPFNRRIFANFKFVSFLPQEEKEEGFFHFTPFRARWKSWCLNGSFSVDTTARKPVFGRSVFVCTFCSLVNILSVRNRILSMDDPIYLIHRIPTKKPIKRFDNVWTAMNIVDRNWTICSIFLGFRQSFNWTRDPLHL